VSHVRYELGVYIPEDGILHSHRRKNIKSYIISFVLLFCSKAILNERFRAKFHAQIMNFSVKILMNSISQCQST
jgi:hypothetical protein